MDTLIPDHPKDTTNARSRVMIDPVNWHTRSTN